MVDSSAVVRGEKVVVCKGVMEQSDLEVTVP